MSGAAMEAGEITDSDPKMRLRLGKKIYRKWMEVLDDSKQDESDESEGYWLNEEEEHKFKELCIDKEGVAGLIMDLYNTFDSVNGVTHQIGLRLKLRDPERFDSDDGRAMLHDECSRLEIDLAKAVSDAMEFVFVHRGVHRNGICEIDKGGIDGWEKTYVLFKRDAGDDRTMMMYAMVIPGDFYTAGTMDLNWFAEIVDDNEFSFVKKWKQERKMHMETLKEIFAKWGVKEGEHDGKGCVVS